MVIFEYIFFKLFKLLIAEWTSVMSIHSLLNTTFAIDMATSGNIAVVDGVQTNSALELLL